MIDQRKAEELLLQTASGDKEAFTQLYDMTARQVYSFLLSMVGDPSRTDDFFQETYIHIYLRAGKYAPKGHPLAWMITLAKHLVLDGLRGKKSALPLMEDAAAPDPAEKSVDRILLAQLLSGLEEEERQMVTLHDIVGLTHREVAGILKMPLGTVLWKYSKAMKKLKDSPYLKEADHE